MEPREDGRARTQTLCSVCYRAMSLIANSRSWIAVPREARLDFSPRDSRDRAAEENRLIISLENSYNRCLCQKLEPPIGSCLGYRGQTKSVLLKRWPPFLKHQIRTEKRHGTRLSSNG
jgi:hypothetical protein